MHSTAFASQHRQQEMSTIWTGKSALVTGYIRVELSWARHFYGIQLDGIFSPIGLAASLDGTLYVTFALPSDRRNNIGRLFATARRHYHKIRNGAANRQEYGPGVLCARRLFNI